MTSVIWLFARLPSDRQKLARRDVLPRVRDWFADSSEEWNVRKHLPPRCQREIHNSTVGPRTCFYGAENSESTMYHHVITFWGRCTRLWLLGALAASIF